MKRVIQIFLGTIAIAAALSIQPLMSSVYVADNWTKERVSNIAFGGFMAVGVTALALGFLPLGRRKRKR